MRIYLVALAILGFPTAAQAQEGVFDMGVLGMNGALSHVQQHEEARARRMVRPRPSERITRRLAQQTRAAPTPAAAVASAAYRPTGTVRQQLAGTMAEAAEQRKPGTAQEMRALVASGSALQHYRRIAPALGLRTDDAIDALAFYLIAQWGVANDHRPDITRAQAAGVRRQAADAFTAIADELRTDADRQLFAETLIVQGVIVAGVHEAAVRANDREALANYTAMAREGGQQLFGTDPTRIALTDKGFRAR